MKLKKLLPYFILITFFSALASFFTVIAPLLLGRIIDILFNLEFSDFFSESSKLFKIYLIIFLSYFLQNELLVHFSANICKELRNSILKKINKLELYSLNSISYGAVLNNFSIDIENIFSAILQAIPKLTGGIIIVIATLYYMFNLNIVLTICLVLITPLVYLLSRFITKNSNQLFKERAHILDELNSFTEEIIKNNKLAQNFNYYEFLEKKFSTLNNKLYKTGRKAQFYSSLANPSTRLISNLSYCLIGILGLYLVSLNKITLGTVTTFLLYSNIFTRPFNEFTSVLTEIQLGKTSFFRIKNFINIQEEASKIKLLPLPMDTKFKGEIEFKNVSFSYNKTQKVLENISFHILPGEHFAIVGKTGSRKNHFS